MPERNGLASLQRVLLVLRPFIALLMNLAFSTLCFNCATRDAIRSAHMLNGLDVSVAEYLIANVKKDAIASTCRTSPEEILSVILSVMPCNLSQEQLPNNAQALLSPTSPVTLQARRNVDHASTECAGNARRARESIDRWDYVMQYASNARRVLCCHVREESMSEVSSRSVFQDSKTTERAAEMHMRYF